MERRQVFDLPADEGARDRAPVDRSMTRKIPTLAS
jgi:hypothetical protein